MNAANVILIHSPRARERAAMFRDGAKVPIPASELVELIVDKHRGGPTGTVRVTFHPSRTLFVDYEGEGAP
jgi:replicative DNA helicase